MRFALLTFFAPLIAMVRLDALVSQVLGCPRKEASTMVCAGDLAIAGTVQKEPRWQVVLGEETSVTLKGEALLACGKGRPMAHRYLLVHKPKRCLCERFRGSAAWCAARGLDAADVQMTPKEAAAVARGCCSVYDLVPEEFRHADLGLFGRLDVDTTARPDSKLPVNIDIYLPSLPCGEFEPGAKMKDFLANEAKGTKIVGAHSIEEMCATLKAPRRIMLLVKAGAPVDQFIEAVLPHTEPGDILIDGGNSLFSDTIRRTAHVEAQGRLFIGTGVSGGEEGARTGPSIMPGGRCRCSRRLSTATFTTASLTSATSSRSAAAWPHVKQIFQAISAKAGKGDEPCCQWVGGGGAGHYVKMVHNGIEYASRRVSDPGSGSARPHIYSSHHRCALDSGTATCS